MATADLALALVALVAFGLLLGVGGVIPRLTARFVAWREERQIRRERLRQEQLKTQKNIVHLVAKKGLFARKRPLVNLECARVLGELGDQGGADSLVKWLEVVLEDKSPNPVAVQYGFQSLAWIGPEDKAAMEFVFEYATTGKHQDPVVAAHAIKAFSHWR